MEGAHDCPMKSLPPFVSSEPAPHLCEEGQPKNCGGEAPAIIFVCPSPDEGVCLEDEVMGGDDLLGLRNAPPPGLSPRRTSHQSWFSLFFGERNVHLKVNDLL